MRKIIFCWLIAFAFGLAVAGERSLAQLPLNAGASKIVTAASYTGPADIVASPAHWYGLRAMSAADRGNPLINVCNVADVACGDLSSDATTGALVITTIGGSSCSIVTCTIKTFYDRAGSANSTQATIANRPTLVVSCINSQPCAAFAPTQYTLATITAISQPYTMSAVAIRTGANTSFGSIFASWDSVNGAVMYFNNAVNQASMFVPASAFNATATDNAWHALQGVFNGASSAINVNDTNTNGTVGTAATITNLAIGANTDSTSALTGKIAETGIWGSAFSTGNRTSMCHNQFVFWGTSVSC